MRCGVPLGNGWKPFRMACFFLMTLFSCLKSPLGLDQDQVVLSVLALSHALRAMVKQLVMPTQVLLDLTHPVITQQFPQAAWVSSCLKISCGARSVG